MSEHPGGQLRLFDREMSRRAFVTRATMAATVPPFLMAAINACSTSPAQTSGSKLKTLVVAIQEGDTRTLDPQAANELTVPMFLRILYDQLVTFPGSDFSTVTKDSASSWNVSADGLTYVFDLNPNVKFSDGSPATADDLVFSYKRHKYLNGPTSWFQDGVTLVEKTGGQQVTIKLNAVNVDLLYILTSPFMSIGKASSMQQHGAVDTIGADKTDTARAWLDQNSAGSGPFVLEAWQHGSQLTMKRNPYYWGQASPVERIVFKFIKDQTTQRDLLVRGDAHIAANLTPDLAVALHSNSKIGILNIPSVGFPWVGMHVGHNPALKIPKNWEAVKYAIDYTGMAQIYQGGGQFMGSCIPPGMNNALPAEERIKTDVQRAKAALQAAGNPNGFSFQLTYASEQLYENIAATDIAQKVRQDLAAVGIQANLNPVPSTQELTDFRAGKLEAAIHFWGADYLGWTDYLPVFAPGGHVAGPRQGWMPDQSPEAKQIADMATQAQQTVDPAKQKDLCLSAQRLMNQVGPYAWLFEANIQVGYRKDLIKSIATNPVTYVDLGTIELV